MKAFTVEESVSYGLRVSVGESGEPCVVIGSNEIPVSQGIVTKFHNRMQAIHDIREAVESGDEALMRKLVMHITRKDSMDWREHALAWASENPDVLWLTHCDISTNEPFRIIDERHKSDVALVHLATRSTGQLWLESNAYDEELMEGNRPFVARRFHDFPSVGMGVVAPGLGPNKEPHGLFLMYPRSSFRINRDQRPETLVVTWPGSTLKCFEPRSQLNREKNASAA